MRWISIASLLTISSAIVAYSGTFVEDFSDGNLDEWHILTMPGPPFSGCRSCEDRRWILGSRPNVWRTEAFGVLGIKNGQRGRMGFLYTDLSN